MLLTRRGPASSRPQQATAECKEEKSKRWNAAASNASKASNVPSSSSSSTSTAAAAAAGEAMGREQQEGNPSRRKKPKYMAFGFFNVQFQTAHTKRLPKQDTPAAAAAAAGAAAAGTTAAQPSPFRLSGEDSLERRHHRQA
ncbi:hypothetical protein Efla_003813 [Eimeria flavescens]